MKLTGTAVIALAAVAGLGVLGLWAWRKGGVVNAVTSAVGSLATGAVDAASDVVGLPTTQETTTDAEVARWIIDNVGQFEASKWAGAPAYLRAQFLAVGSGKPPPANSPAGRALLPLVSSYDETDRLLRRYPTTTSPDSLFSTLPGLTFSEGAGLPL
jgi:hypothetical protein